MSHDERLLDVSDNLPEAALLWPWLLTTFDDWGRARAEPRRLKAQLFPGNELVTVDLIARTLAELSDVGLIGAYEHAGKRYMAIRSEVWFRWQTHIRKEKRDDDSGSTCPPPPESAFSRNGALFRESARENTPSPSPSPTPSKAAAASFDSFNSTRASTEALSQKQAGAEIRNVGAVAAAIAKRPDFLAESKRLWGHRDHESCKGSGFIESYAPGAGTVKTPCGET
jgi:hypothetical protein